MEYMDWLIKGAEIEAIFNALRSKKSYDLELDTKSIENEWKTSKIDINNNKNRNGLKIENLSRVFLEVPSY